MKSLPLACVLALAVGPAALADEPPPVESFRADLDAAEIAAGRAANTRSVAAQAFLYHLPAFVHLRQLTEFIQGRQYFFPKEAPLGGWVLVRQLADPKTDNVQPNVDTLYGASYLWLAEQGPVVLSVPAIADRYYSVAILDAWLNNFAYVGTRTTGTDAGDYLIVPPGWAGETPAGIRAVIQAPTPVINLFQRIFVRDTAPDLEVVRRLQDSIRIRPLADYVARTERGFAPIDLKAFALPGLRRVGDPLRFFELMSFYTAINHPPVEDRGLAALFSAAGIGPGSTLPADPSLREALVEGFADGRKIINAAISHGPFRNGWTVPDPNMGRLGPHLLTRAVTQMTAMGANVPEEAMYFTAHRDGSGALLDGASRYTLTFPAGRLPPVGKHGFWSVTLYNREGYLVDNPIARYVVRPDTAGLRYGADGALTLHLQATRPAGEDAANWLPAPAGSFFVTLRTYQPDEAIVSGAWFPEAIKRRP